MALTTTSFTPKEGRETRSVDQRTREYIIERVFYVAGDIESVRQRQGFSSSVPQMGDKYGIADVPGVPELRVDRVIVEPRSESTDLVDVSVRYSSFARENPNSPDMRVSVGTEQVVYSHNPPDGKALPEEVAVEYPVLEAVWSQVLTPYTILETMDFIGSTNSAPWLGLSANSWTLAGINSSERRGENRAVLEFLFRGYPDINGYLFPLAEGQAGAEINLTQRAKYQYIPVKKENGDLESPWIQQVIVRPRSYPYDILFPLSLVGLES